MSNEPKTAGPELHIIRHFYNLYQIFNVVCIFSLHTVIEKGRISIVT